jgi:hypothetical protein
LIIILEFQQDEQPQCPAYESIFPEGPGQNFAIPDNQTKVEPYLHTPTAPPLPEVPVAIPNRESEKQPYPEMTKARTEDEILVEEFESLNPGMSLIN